MCTIAGIFGMLVCFLNFNSLYPFDLLALPSDSIAPNVCVGVVFMIIFLLIVLNVKENDTPKAHRVTDAEDSENSPEAMDGDLDDDVNDGGDAINESPNLELGGEFAQKDASGEYAEDTEEELAEPSVWDVMRELNTLPRELILVWLVKFFCG